MNTQAFRGSIEVKDPTSAVDAFLEEHSAAKIVVLVDTHCIENGQLVYKGHAKDPASYQACYMEEVCSCTVPSHHALTSSRSFVAVLQILYQDSCHPKQARQNTITKA
jgi:hypothetical protein